MLAQSCSPASGLGGNDTLRLASTFHSLYAIAAQISPVAGSTGIEMLHTESFSLCCFQTATGIIFFVTADATGPKGAPDGADMQRFLRKAYELFADYVLKNPFYELDQVIKCEPFDIHLQALVAAYNR